MLVAHAELDQAGHAGGRFQVAQIGFHRAHHQPVAVLAVPAQRFTDRARFDGIADRRTGSVRFDVPNAGRDICTVEDRQNQAFLRFRVRYRDAVGSAVLIASRSSH